jgi:hypothetical protein
MNILRINPYSIPVLITSLIVLTIGIIVYSKKRKSILNLVFFLLCFPSSIWLFFSFLSYNSLLEETAYFWYKFSYVGVVFITCAFFHYGSLVLGVNIKFRFLVILGYIASTICSILIWTSPYIIEGVYKYFWGYYPKRGSLHPLFLIYFLSYIFMSVILLTYHFLAQKRHLLI